MKKSYISFYVILISTLLINGCAIYPSTHIYYEPSALDGEPYDSTPCSHLTKEYDSIKRFFGKTVLTASARYQKNDKLQIVIVIEPRGNKIDFNSALFSIIDNDTGTKYVPSDNKVQNRSTRVATSGFFKSEIVFEHRITLTYPVLSESVSNFNLIFPKDSIKSKSRPLNISPITFVRKKIKTVGYGSINC